MMKWAILLLMAIGGFVLLGSADTAAVDAARLLFLVFLLVFGILVLLAIGTLIGRIVRSPAAESRKIEPSAPDQA